MMRILLILFTVSFLITLNACNKDKPLVLPDTVYFPRVKSIIQNNCLSCHSSSGSWAGKPIKFDSDSDITKQYKSIKVSVADPISPFNRRMPQGGKLSDFDVNLIVLWYNKGGKVTD